MPGYIDAFVLPVHKKKLKAYARISRVAGKVWKEHGALDYVECVSEDASIPCGVPFARIAGAKKGETVVFSWIMYKSRAHRDAVNKKVMKDKRLAACMDMKNMPFDMARMSMGGFEVFVRG